ncbi:MAG: heavy-metal-associated domain-containing protein [Bosea sp.]|uniref:heavy-metal-associated domain-containing protein n=1 Tax=Bosea sp. (in: a-proteobacteria) TaxID=1871050 RepID=UPI001AD014D2|nr:heavy-metal-associated domain-containing protein [Bosea sp. (in: a-proteobacteria)]MBN9453569.1 heavy-metal-associated domain-containing protein [Bosea sp. (in: a-proteobacteria)]
MCSCRQHATIASSTTRAPAGAVILRVDDMTCSHCAGTIERAVRDAFPGATVTADPVSKLVTVLGGGDFAGIGALVTAAGYTPRATPAR